MNGRERDSIWDRLLPSGGSGGDEYPYADEASFIALDEELRNEVEQLTIKQRTLLAERWQGGLTPHRLPEDLRGEVRAWLKDLEHGDRVSDYCAAVAGLIRRYLLAASVTGNVSGRIESLQKEPYLEIYATPSSALAQDNGLGSGGAVRIGADAIAAHIAMRCQVDLKSGELAWRFIAAILPEADCVLPEIETRQTRDGAIEVRLALMED